MQGLLIRIRTSNQGPVRSGVIIIRVLSSQVTCESGFYVSMFGSVSGQIQPGSAILHQNRKKGIMYEMYELPSFNMVQSSCRFKPIPKINFIIIVRGAAGPIKNNFFATSLTCCMLSSTLFTFIYQKLKKKYIQYLQEVITQTI